MKTRRDEGTKKRKGFDGEDNKKEANQTLFFVLPGALVPPRLNWLNTKKIYA
ncbi:MAG: hypothetical protein ABIQ00_22805 [Chitinophagaceae bacterium]